MVPAPHSRSRFPGSEQAHVCFAVDSAVRSNPRMRFSVSLNLPDRKYTSHYTPERLRTVIDQLPVYALTLLAAVTFSALPPPSFSFPSASGLLLQDFLNECDILPSFQVSCPTKYSVSKGIRSFS